MHSCSELLKQGEIFSLSHTHTNSTSPGVLFFHVVLFFSPRTELESFFPALPVSAITVVTIKQKKNTTEAELSTRQLLDNVSLTTCCSKETYKPLIYTW